VTNLGANYGLLIRGSNFGKGEQVAITVDWTVGSETAAYPLLANTDSVLGAFQTTFREVFPPASVRSQYLSENPSHHKRFK
jgi:hypothetical protein